MVRQEIFSQLCVLALSLVPCTIGYSQSANPPTNPLLPTAEPSSEQSAEQLPEQSAEQLPEQSAEQTNASEDSAVQPVTIGQTKNTHRLGELYFAGQFPKEDLAKIQAENIERIITLRTEGEIDWDERAAVEAAGIEFVEIPFRSPETLTDQVFDRVRKTLAQSDQRTLFHCGSANRVGGVWLPYRVLDQGIDLETALAEAKEIGLNSPLIQAMALDYIKRQQAMPAMGGETSVKPGVNDSFTNPELDVDAFVKRFEIESREIYLNREKILAACEIEKGDTVADIGAGTGLFSRLFAVAVGDDGWVYAVDIAPRFLEHINQEAAKYKLSNLTSVLCAQNSVNLPPDSVDVVFICDTYHHFEYPTSTLASIHGTLKKDGHMIVIDFERIEGKSRDWTMGHVRGGKEVFRDEILDAGFTLVEEKTIDGFEENYFLKFKKD